MEKYKSDFLYVADEIGKSDESYAAATAIVIVTTEDGEKALSEVLAGLPDWRVARGGATRALSVQSGLSCATG